MFVSDIPPKDKKQRKVYGHFTFVRNPLRTFSVLEPGGVGGCSTRWRATVEKTARHGQCLVAQNGGYFDMDTGECLGNVVSDGRLVKNAGGLQNAQFGIRKDGTMVFGYLSEEDVLDPVNPFMQLVSGVVWLLRNGEVYINQSKTAECDETQTTGNFDKFINVISARTAVGHDSQGQLILVHVDGQTDARGSFNGMWRCPRDVSTVMCIHEPTCEPPDCNSHGRCVLGECQCIGNFWRGPNCSLLDCGPSNCSLHGICTESGCLCDAGWIGSNCSEACASGFYGDGCAQRCLCHNGGECDPVHGSCTCPAGYRGALCQQECLIGQYGPNCQKTCECEHKCPCDQETGSCNITYPSTLQDQLSRAGQCLASQMSVAEKSLLTENQQTEGRENRCREPSVIYFQPPSIRSLQTWSGRLRGKVNSCLKNTLCMSVSFKYHPAAAWCLTVLFLISYYLRKEHGYTFLSLNFSDMSYKGITLCDASIWW
ncbi:N-acetylglucosamine-1-phosphodiester alpha-N-acetylglucosaminidase isoform X4 [Alligator sinensis]|uniref:N-acetylglucosamine-1-phosphodiester alpha-N-acetylglucosaminidase isoform X4 n=1 Tax=Alligator sinensis TaxID=38654 RepID=A0A3Q0GIN5_ALLSI|nr:N-acetylglucosamine-1-phosphodiester alpha-N-acetylglucosaminidase isoform X4 [Alligator sinensis]